MYSYIDTSLEMISRDAKCHESACQVTVHGDEMIDSLVKIPTG